jgi:hypothetical protein
MRELSAREDRRTERLIEGFQASIGTRSAEDRQALTEALQKALKPSE